VLLLHPACQAIADTRFNIREWGPPSLKGDQEDDARVLTVSSTQDRRPITPPPCVRLVVKDEATGKEIDIK
jgi:hypothetical protein